MENKTEIVIANYIETMMKERRQRIFASDEYIQQDNGDLVYLEERYNSLNIPHTIRRVIDDYIACLESRDERYADRRNFKCRDRYWNFNYTAGVQQNASSEYGRFWKDSTD